MLATFPVWLPVVLLAAGVTAQANTFATPSNTSYTAPANDSQHIVLQVVAQNGARNGMPFDLVALTQNATAVIPASPSATSGLSGNLTAVSDRYPTPPTNSQDIALISCDTSAYSGEIGVDQLVTNSIGANVSAIIFYTIAQAQCSLSVAFQSDFGNVYSTTSARSAQQLVMASVDPSIGATGAILTLTALNNWINNSQSGSQGSLPGGPSTAVAMIILYSITGVITALFLVIIVTGAIRAHRHPERYGPRNIIGRARQSRAKGIARAMLETIPIVKFGDEAPVKDVELSGPSSADHAKPENTGTVDAAGTTTTNEQSKDASSPPRDATSVAYSSPNEDENKATCSICTEDFEKGQDIRLLPCNHKFHPACVDPWLLDISGTCPLCRVDLRPAEAAESGTDTTGMPPPLDPLSDPASGNNSPGSRLRGLLRRLQPSTAEERVAALRRFRQENASREPSAEGPAMVDGEEAHASRWERVRRRLL